MENQRRGGGAAVKEVGMILSTTFLSLLLPLSFLLLARLSAARHSSSSAVNDHEFLRSNTALILSLAVSAVAVEALVRGLKGIHGAAAEEMSDFAVGNPVSPRRVVFVLGLHEAMLFWRRSAVAPVVDETVVGFSREGFGWVEDVVLAAAFGNLWWRRLRDEAEALVVLPWVGAEMEAADAVGWLLYYVTAAIGGVRAIKGLSWAAMWIFGHRRLPEKKGVNAAVNISV